ncbi:UreE urease accessory domain protein [Solidesulfovibrio fructosivorans JJ]]|uniref:Urease accessory protein UreE n=1 Tax=Solidesulfovibrio fructosivorans JJ] TaxID=596151 RepID=E1JTD5_SOLFR|nr:urease accessory protein UreE [Solidesulfovibrio fructosivorans]EFL52395.1 UreE urease accessory domain protein [Solidesulfovibrio fructosivorans JJ]]
MVTYVRVLPPREAVGATLGEAIRLDHEARRKTRQRVATESGLEAALFLPRGTVLRAGDRVVAGDGRSAVITAADEALSVVRSGDPVLLARAAFHLGNRHATIMIEPGCISYPTDAVLDDMLRGLGFLPEAVHGPFEPEDGAYVFVFDAAVGGVGGTWIP